MKKISLIASILLLFSVQACFGEMDAASKDTGLSDTNLDVELDVQEDAAQDGDITQNGERDTTQNGERDTTQNGQTDTNDGDFEDVQSDAETPPEDVGVREKPQVFVKATEDEDFLCGGLVESNIWDLWDLGLGDAEPVKDWLEDRVQEVVVGNDVKGLYNTELVLTPLLTMIVRCGRTERLKELADAVLPVYSVLEPLPEDPEGRLSWVCHEGTPNDTCRNNPGTEQRIYTRAGLAWLNMLARYMAESGVPAVANHPFVEETLEISVSMLLRWATAFRRNEWRHGASDACTPELVTGGGLCRHFDDNLRLQVTSYANIAGTLKSRPDLLTTLSDTEKEEVSSAAALALAFYAARTQPRTVNNEWLGGEALATAADSGYLKLHWENSLAGYEGTEHPRRCNADGTLAEKVIDPKDYPVPETLAIDFSHARRLYPLSQSVEENAQAMRQVYDLKEDEVPLNRSKWIAANLVAAMWNGDLDNPKFTNYLDGSNGWYRIGYYDSKDPKKACYGVGPYGASSSFFQSDNAMGGQYYPIITTLDRRFYLKSSGTPNPSTTSGKSYHHSAVRNWPSLIQPAVAGSP